MVFSSGVPSSTTARRFGPRYRRNESRRPQHLLGQDMSTFSRKTGREEDRRTLCLAFRGPAALRGGWRRLREVACTRVSYVRVQSPVGHFLLDGHRARFTRRLAVSTLVASW